MFFGPFVLLIKKDQELPSHVHGEIWPRSTQFWLGFLGFNSILKVTFLGHPVVGVGDDVDIYDNAVVDDVDDYP